MLHTPRRLSKNSKNTTAQGLQGCLPSSKNVEKPEKPGRTGQASGFFEFFDVFRQALLPLKPLPCGVFRVFRHIAMLKGTSAAVTITGNARRELALGHVVFLYATPNPQQRCI